MFILNWIREWKQIRNEFPKDEKICDSCETLKMQLAIANDEKRALLNRLLEKPTTEVQQDVAELKPILPRHMLNWRARQQLLEREDREKAKILNRQAQESAIKPVTNSESEVPKTVAEPFSTEDLEKEMDMVSAKREAQKK